MSEPRANRGAPFTSSSPDPTMPEGVRYEHFDAGEVSLRVATLGAGAPVLLLHGFPENHRAFRHQMRPLADAGYLAVAPDLRGYGGSSKPRSVEAYRLSSLVGDVAALARGFGRGEPVAVVGHDWGGVVAYELAARHPELVSRLAILNAPHPRRMRELLLRSGAQRRRSWYVFFFQLPRLPERLLRSPGFVRRVFVETCERKEAWDPATLAAYAAEIARPGAASAMLAYYRAAFRHPKASGRPVLCPTLVLWGDRDHALGPEVPEGMHAYVRDLRVEHAPGATHWLQHDRPGWVSERLVAFLRGEI